MAQVRFISETVGVNGETPEQLISYCARVSNPKNQENYNTAPKLLKFCMNPTDPHWSIFEMATACFEVKTTRAIAAQILRHRSFSFQEFSQRYAVAQNFEIVEARRQDTKNRQNSVDDLDEEVEHWFYEAQQKVILQANQLYDEALSKGIAKECARFLLPLNTQTVIYMQGNFRSWIHYINLRTSNGTQKEHVEIAKGIKDIFVQRYPIVSEAAGWITTS